MVLLEACLLDTPLASAILDARSSRHTITRERLDTLDAYIYLPAIALAEIEYGLAISPQIDETRHALVRNAMAMFTVMDVDRHTAPIYGQVKADLFMKYAPRAVRRSIRTKYVEDLCDLVSGKELGIQENDLWIVSIAIQYNLLLLTSDSAGGMRRVVETAGYEHRTQFWAVP